MVRTREIFQAVTELVWHKTYEWKGTVLTDKFEFDDDRTTDLSLEDIRKKAEDQKEKLVDLPNIDPE